MPEASTSVHQQHGLHSSVSSSRAGSRPETPYDAAQGSLILRIKRKRGADPIAALRIESLLSSGFDPEEAKECAKSDEAENSGIALAGTSPEDGVHVRPKRRLTDRGVFRLAETVPLTSFDSAEQTKELEERIAKLKRPSRTAQREVEAKPEEAEKKPSAPSTTDPSNLRFKVVSHPKSTPRRSLFDTLKGNNNSSGSLRLKGQRQVRTISRPKRSTQDSRSKPYSRPRYIDAVVEQKREKAKSGTEDEEMNALDLRFAGLLGEYLKEQDLEAPSDLRSSSSKTNGQSPRNGSSSAEEEEESDSESEYVYDIYYRERKDTKAGLTSLSASQVGLQPSEVVGHEKEAYNHAHMASQTGQVIPLEPMATLVGLSDFDLGDDEEIEKGSRLVSEEMLDSDDPYEEGEDEDSNDEGFYRNDYPEQEADDDDDLDASAWGWNGPRRHDQRRLNGSDSDIDDGEEDDEPDF